MCTSSIFLFGHMTVDFGPQPNSRLVTFFKVTSIITAIPAFVLALVVTNVACQFLLLLECCIFLKFVSKGIFAPPENGSRRASRLENLLHDLDNFMQTFGLRPGIVLRDQASIPTFTDLIKMYIVISDRSERPASIKPKAGLSESKKEPEYGYVIARYGRMHTILIPHFLAWAQGCYAMRFISGFCLQQSGSSYRSSLPSRGITSPVLGLTRYPPLAS